MAQPKRSKTQARRSGGRQSTGLPGWAWLVLGVLLTLVAVIAAPKLLESEQDGFFRPKPNPDAQPEPVEDEAVVDEAVTDDDVAAAAKPKAATAEKPRDFDFYTLLPGKEVPVSDAELAANERAEKEQAAKEKPAETKEAETKPSEPKPTEPDAVADTRPLPKPVDEATPTAPATPRPATPPPATPAPADAPAKPETPPSTASVRYLLQAGAFGAANQAEELKAKIALLGVGARVETAEIGGKMVYRVRMGPYGSASDLAEAKRKLAGGGLAAIAVKVN